VLVARRKRDRTVHPIDSGMTMPAGIAPPCNYQLTTDTGQEVWTFDFDCRDHMKERADALFAQYKAGSTDMVNQYNALADAGTLNQLKGSDAGVPIHAPSGAVEVEVGAKGLDHHGQGLLFIDDDAPCYVRVVGPDAQRRLALARAIAKNLTFANAPMIPRPFP
jgi:glucose dehydrogenase